jgi:hypothetical protein
VGIKCSGYPDPTQLIIYDETKSTINRKRRGEIALRRPPPLLDPLSTILLPSWEVRAKTFFISQYVADLEKENLFSYMRVFYPPEKGQFPLLSTVIRAVWLAFFSFSHQSPTALHNARVSYGSALMLTTSAIQSPLEVNENRTLMSLLLLTIYERLINWGERSMPPSNAHLRGALGLVLYRGDSQFADPIRMNMLRALQELVILECLAHELDIPNELLMLSSKVFDKVGAPDPQWQFLRVMLEYAQLKELLRHGISPDVAISWAENLGCKLKNLSHHLRPVTPGRQIGERSRTSGVKLSISYPDHNSRKSWNNIRILRMLLADIVREQCAKSLGMPNTTRTEIVIEKLHDSTRTINTLCSEIYSSALDSSIALSASGNTAAVQISTLFFHLYAANCFKVVSDRLRQLIRKRLQSLGTGQFSGVQRLMMHLLQEIDGCQQNLWKAWLRLGKESFTI